MQLRSEEKKFSPETIKEDPLDIRNDEEREPRNIEPKERQLLNASPRISLEMMLKRESRGKIVVA